MNEEYVGYLSMYNNSCDMKDERWYYHEYHVAETLVHVESVDDVRIQLSYMVYDKGTETHYRVYKVYRVY